MKRITKLFGVLLAFALMFTATAVKADPFDYDTINGESTKLKKYLVVDKNTNIPGVTFSFTVAAGAAVDPGEGTLPVYAGTGSPTIADVTFNAGESADAATALDADEGYTEKIGAKKDITINFSSAVYDKPGVYRYVVTETASTEPGVVNDSQPKRTIDVYVEDNNGELVIAGYVSYEGEFTAAPKQSYTPNGAATDGYANGVPEGSGDMTKSNKYVNEYITNELELSKQVTGNQGDKESQWEMKVNFETLATGYNVKYAKVKENGTPISEPTYTDYTNNSAITLGHDDTYDFIGIPEGVKYTVTETKENQDGYTTTYTNEKTHTYADDDEPEDVLLTVENNRQGVLPTGVMAATSTGLIIAGVGLAGLLIMRRKKDEDED
ncbi:MAG: hypothetical protein J6D29_02240 [Solobacterium sp.]|nr:hypothetical protein [Solobacterium sp.]